MPYFLGVIIVHAFPKSYAKIPDHPLHKVMLAKASLEDLNIWADCFHQEYMARKAIGSVPEDCDNAETKKMWLTLTQEVIQQRTIIVALASELQNFKTEFMASSASTADQLQRILAITE